MKSRGVTAALLISILLLVVSLANADTISSSQAGTDSNTFFPGQSVTTALIGGPWNNIIFNWYSDVPATTPTAFGTLFLLTQEYLDTPNNLSAATTGYLAQATASGGYYTFATSVTLQPGTQYFFYTNASGLNSGGLEPYPGGNLYFTFSGTVPFTSNIVDDVNFLLQGTPVTASAVPEPSSFLLFGTGLASLIAITRRKLVR